MTKIEKYIQFAIENRYEKDNYLYFNRYEERRTHWVVFKDIEDWEESNENLYEVITSKPFIEAIARGIKYKDYDFNYWMYDTNWWNIQDKITFFQAIAIRDNKLEEFINNLWI